MVNISNKVIGACIVLMMEQYKKRKTFAIEGVLFSKDEIITWANSLFPMNAEVKESAMRPSAMREHCLQSGSEDSLHEYYRLSRPDSGNSSIQDTLTNEEVSVIIQKYLPNLFQNAKEFLNAYFRFIDKQDFPLQTPSAQLDFRGAVWIAAATLTYNEYVRTKSTNLLKYSFQIKTIDYLARKLVSFPPLSGFNTLIGSTCTKGANRPVNPFLIATNEGKRRLARTGEVDYLRPDNIPLDYEVNSIDGSVSVRTLVLFMSTHYTSFQFIADEPIVLVTEPHPDSVALAYRKEDFLQSVYMNPEECTKLLALIRRKQNIILQGAPGTGKTFCAKKLAFAFMAENAEERVQTIQFHQGYSYEDFVEGYRPTETGYVLKKGIFYDFCMKASADRENDYFFIIDEMNRGNLSKIFGELFTLLEKGKRGELIKLVYSGESFYVPKNVYIIGLMNTADRSLAMIDYALRRRFGFFTMKPGFDTDGFQRYISEFEGAYFRKLIEVIQRLNNAIADDVSLGEGFCIGHSFFCNMNKDSSEEETKETLESIIENEIIPLLEEYWFDERDKFDEWSSSLRSALA